jgi:ABC-type iron transport system FetAB permease component
MQILRVVILIIMLVVGILITTFYWNTEQFSAIKQVSVYLMVLIMSYIVLHFIKRLIFNEVNWWDWLYYLGLIGILCSGMFANSSNENFFHWSLDIGSVFFIIPVILDIREWLSNRSAKS